MNFGHINRRKESAMALLPSEKFSEIHNEVLAATQPATELERWFASEIAYATWELERVRANTAATHAEARLCSASNRASRNWNRARKELTRLQTARVNPASRVPVAKRASAQLIDNLLDQLVAGTAPADTISILARQEAA
jgi:hypothetical protein